MQAKGSVLAQSDSDLGISDSSQFDSESYIPYLDKINNDKRELKNSERLLMQGIHLQKKKSRMLEGKVSPFEPAFMNVNKKRVHPIIPNFATKFNSEHSLQPDVFHPPETERD